MTAINDAYQAIFKRVPGVDRYYKKRITGKIDNTKTDLLITPVVGSYTVYGSNIPTIEVQEIEIQIFIGKENKKANLDTIKNSIVSFLVPKWQVSYGPDEGTDPETDESMLTFHFTRNYERKLN
ncbi:DUF806 family protein [Lactobacillus hominis]|uniref:Uncharacterized protein n=1 Tax=Lactobacillus hominis DSM 23910 = CRBIP 24.179 TaxID=1423758 RepID=I7LAK2_9LACO|nr:DUF806 family protein [Lactobacillus hominis]KRM84385.1 hypothetical protein FC41_GL000784 [Lactobacillus hominis DSM 23910 = CRBIP 24.179]MCT3347726.1 DUF806 family protein [Lactobacillus hominis]CCI82319.1 Putative uncharacterized protein [Lactobacillus hominis DSM 23910 = CRBIP 24.179]